MIIWEKYIDEENKLINNADRRFRRHSYSMEYMSEELVNKKSIEKYEQDELISCITDDVFMSHIKNENLINAISKLSFKQRKAIELFFWQGFKQQEIAEIMGCTRRNVSKLISTALNKIKEDLSN